MGRAHAALMGGELDPSSSSSSLPFLSLSLSFLSTLSSSRDLTLQTSFTFSLDNQHLASDSPSDSSLPCTSSLPAPTQDPSTSPPLLSTPWFQQVSLRQQCIPLIEEEDCFSPRKWGSPRVG